MIKNIKYYHVKAFFSHENATPEIDFGIKVANAKIIECICLPYGEIVDFDDWFSLSQYKGYSDEKYEDSMDEIQNEYELYRKNSLFGQEFDGEYEYIEHTLEDISGGEIVDLSEGKKVKDTVFKFILDYD